MNKEKDPRVEVLNAALFLEHETSVFLAALIGVEGGDDWLESTYSFSNKSSALSFNAKIHLLIDMGALDKAAKNKFITFMEIRNQFIHNLWAFNYEACITKYVPDKKNYLLGLHKPKRSISVDKHLEKSVHILTRDVMNLTSGILDKVGKRNGEKYIAEWHKKFINEFMRQMNKYEETPPAGNFMSLRKDKSYSKKEVLEFADKYVRRIFRDSMNKIE